MRKSRSRQLLLIALAASIQIVSYHVRANSTPAAICPTGTDTPYPAYSNTGDTPSIAIWRDLTSLPVNCHIALDEPAALGVALAAHFTFTGTSNELATRLGAISELQGIKYWSVTDNNWRELITDASALRSANPTDTREDFTAQEMLSGQTLHFAQNDTRSWGTNVYSVQKKDSSPNQLVFFSENVSNIKLGLITLFAKNTAQSITFITQANGTLWSYYSLAVIKDGTFAAKEHSLINRQAALYRFLIGQASDQEPPLAR